MSNDLQSTTYKLEHIVSLCKRRGFVFQSSEIYGGVNGLYDFGHLGTLMKEKIRTTWKRSLAQFSDHIFFLEGTVLGPSPVWEASGHVANFHDPMVDCLECKKRYRADELDLAKGCPHCGKKSWTDVRQFNMMFKTFAGASAEHGSTVYLRPETAQSIFINFKQLMTTNRAKIPFGVAQLGKAFRNEITPKQFLFRMREFEQMEIEWFCKQEESDSFFTQWVDARLKFYEQIGVKTSHIRPHEHAKDELAHYSKRCIDVQYLFPFGWKELEGIAHRASFDLSQHTKFSGKDLSVYDEEKKIHYMPEVVECSVGVDRLFTTLLCDAYDEEEVNGEKRIVLHLSPLIAPITAAVLPLTKELEEKTHAVYTSLKRNLSCTIDYDASGSIGKRYRRYDEIGTPFCFTYDFTTEQDSCVTVRNRDTLLQERVHLTKIESYIENAMKNS